MRRYVRISHPSIVTRIWSPRRIPNVMLWADASKLSSVVLNGSNVSRLSDQSGNNKDFVQTSAAFQPQYLTGAQGINGLPCIRFTGATPTWMSSPVGKTIQPYTWAVAFRSPSSYVASGFFIGTANRNDGGVDASAVGANFINAPPWLLNMFGGIGTADVTGYLAASTRNRAILTFNGASSVYGVNGSYTSNLNAGTRGFSGIEIGAWGGGGNAANVDIAEVVVISGIPSVTDRNRLDKYFLDKWNVDGGV